MGFRFHKSFKLFPGVRVNLSKTGTSLSVGRKGMTTNVSTRGQRTTVGLPGTGLSYSTRTRSAGRGWGVVLIVVLLVIAARMFG